MTALILCSDQVPITTLYYWAWCSQSERNSARTCCILCLSPWLLSGRLCLQKVSWYWCMVWKSTNLQMWVKQIVTSAKVDYFTVLQWSSVQPQLLLSTVLWKFPTICWTELLHTLVNMATSWLVMVLASATMTRLGLELHPSVNVRSLLADTCIRWFIPLYPQQSTVPHWPIQYMVLSRSMALSQEIQHTMLATVVTTW